MPTPRWPAVAALSAGLFLAAGSAADPPDAAKKGLQQVGEFVGEWKGAGTVAGKKTVWKETLSWGWSFKAGEPRLTLTVADGKYLKSGSLAYLPDKKLYRLTATDPAGTELVYDGKLARGRLTLDSKDAATGDVRRLTLYTVGDGSRLLLVGETQAKGKGLFSKAFEVAANKVGESFAGGGGKKAECVVTGGLGTIPVSHNGKTYYVCCSGCRDEFTANPQKYIDEFEKARKK
jgi:hypothetical protein